MGIQKRLHAERHEAKRKKAETHIDTSDLPRFTRATSFSNYASLVAASKNKIFLITRLRPIGDDNVEVTSLGTGFLVGNARMMTCSHVVNSDTDNAKTHQDGDLYVFTMRNTDDNNQWLSTAPIPLKMNQTMFDYPESDMAILYLPKEFYYVDTKLIHHPDDYLVLARNPSGIGVDIGVLGYPLQQVIINQHGIDVSSVFIRGDKGVVNTRYTNDNVTCYEFTVAFNPGNSGGPIFNIETGEVIAIVHGYNSIPIQFAKEKIPDHLNADLGDEAVSVVRSNYSIGMASQNYLDQEKAHDIAFGS